MKRRERYIKKYLKNMEEFKKGLPKEYHPMADATEIRYGFMGRKTITVEEIKNYEQKSKI